jgi:hypothetical protein
MCRVRTTVLVLIGWWAFGTSCPKCDDGRDLGVGQIVGQSAGIQGCSEHDLVVGLL